ncbi:MAG: hypothetical protein KC448_04720 [Yoonia sp.]|nr:hypothetical protein [Yoonia sp.]
MTALREYERLESGGIWRADLDAQRRDVTVSFGNATLVITDGADRPLTHWSLPAVIRQNPGKRPAVFTPDEGAVETLEIDDDLMIGAIEKVRKTLAKSRPQRGKLRHFITLGFVAGTAALAVFWLPDALTRQTVTVVPPSKRAEIGAIVLGHVQKLTGPRCRDSDGVAALELLHARLLGADANGQIVILPQLAQGAVAMTGGIIALDRRIVENADDPAVPAGYIIAADAARRGIDPLASVLQAVGLRQTMGLLTTGNLPSDVLADYARSVTQADPTFAKDDDLITAFAAAQIPTTPFAYARDGSGQRTVKLIEGDAFAERDEPEILSDANWIRLQGICNL